MAQFASDAFAGTDGTGLATYNAAWVVHPEATDTAVISDAGRARTSSTGNALYYHSGSPASADYSVSADLVFKEANGGTGFTGVVGRTDTTAATFYMFRYGGGTSDAWQLHKCVSGTFTLLGSSAQTIADESSIPIRLEMVGDQISGYINGSSTPTITVTDASITAAGKAGVRVTSAATNTTGIHLDNFSADDVGGGTSAVSSDLGDNYALRADTASDLTDSYVLRTAVSGDLGDSYLLRSGVSADLGDSYLLRDTADSDLADSYALRANVASDYGDSYTLDSVSSVGSNLADAYEIRAAVGGDLADSYALRASVSGDFGDAYTLRSNIDSDLADSYAIASASSVASDLGDGYLVRAAVSGDLDDAYAMRSVVAGDLEDAWLLRSGVAAEFVDLYSSRNFVSGDLGDTYLSAGLVYSDLGDAYAIDGELHDRHIGRRLYTVPRENRIYTVPRENRIYTVKD